MTLPTNPEVPMATLALLHARRSEVESGSH